jgi:hypothetical protein
MNRNKAMLNQRFLLTDWIDGVITDLTKKGPFQLGIRKGIFCAIRYVYGVNYDWL